MTPTSEEWVDGILIGHIRPQGMVISGNVIYDTVRSDFSGDYHTFLGSHRIVSTQLGDRWDRPTKTLRKVKPEPEIIDW